MASIRTIKVRDAELKWNTRNLRYLIYSHNNILDTYREIVKPGLVGKIEKHSDIRRVVSRLVEEAIESGKIESMNDWVNLVMALRLTEIDETLMEDNGFKIRLLCPKFESDEKKTFWNIAWHMNHHCKQLYKCCYIQVYGSYESIYGRVALAYTAGEAYDRKDYFLDRYYERDRNPVYRRNKNGEWST